MGCVGSKKQERRVSRSEAPVPKITILNETQIRLLTMLYEDCASRSIEDEMTMENFLLFFHKNGYWGERLFKQFDTGNTNTVTQEEFLRGIAKIFKTTPEKKIQLLYKFFSDCKQGITFPNFLKMLYNYPKQEIKKIIIDTDFINNELKGSLVGLDKEVMGRRFQSLVPHDVQNNQNNAVNGCAFRLEQNESNSEKMQSKYGAKILNEMNKRSNERSTTFNVKVGETNVQIKTTSVHQLVKRFAKSIFKKYNINEKEGRMNFESFSDWVKNHKTLYNDYYKGFHSEVWEVDRETNMPRFVSLSPQYSSKARVFIEDKPLKITIALMQSILIVCHQTDNTNPIGFICLEGLSACQIFTNENGYGIEISHREGVYNKKIFYLINETVQKQWMEFLKFYKGQAATQIYQIKQQIGIGKFSVVYRCVQKATGQNYAIKVIESFKLDEQAKKIIAHESGIMSVMSHPLLVFYKETIVTKTHIYIITQLVKGKDLYELVKQFKYLNEAQSCFILEQIIIGVRYIHSLGIVHRDLKAQNIMVEYDTQKDSISSIKIIDFGFANYLGSLHKMPRDQLLAGTPNYIAPQTLKREEISQKIDNFAIGSIMYFMLSGNLPFNSHDVAVILQKTIEGAFPLNDKKWKNVSDLAKDLVSKLLQNDPNERIDLDTALKHEWFTSNRLKRKSKTSMHIEKHEQRASTHNHPTLIT